MAGTVDPVSGFQFDPYEPMRPIGYATTDEVAERQRAEAERRLAAGEAMTTEARLLGHGRLPRRLGTAT